jgi:hypothetical protein
LPDTGLPPGAVPAAPDVTTTWCRTETGSSKKRYPVTSDVNDAMHLPDGTLSDTELKNQLS